MNVDGAPRAGAHAWREIYVAGRQDIYADEILATIEKTPEVFSPNVLLRAIVQDSLLPTAAYVGGPAEVAYMAQVEVVYRGLRRRCRRYCRARASR